MARLAAEVDFDVWVLDDRAAYASRERFPHAERLIVGDIGPTLKELAAAGSAPRRYCLIVTRGHNHDEEALYHLAPTRGRLRRHDRQQAQDQADLRGPAGEGHSAGGAGKVHAPLGFDIGSQTVPEIAVSIVAELIACRNLGASAPRPRVRVQVGSARA